jgi:hypothetical protein
MTDRAEDACCIEGIMFGKGVVCLPRLDLMDAQKL